MPELAGRTVLVAVDGPADDALVGLVEGGARVVRQPEGSGTAFEDSDRAIADVLAAHGSVDVLLLPVPPRTSEPLEDLDPHRWRTVVDAVTRRSAGLLRAFARQRVSLGGGGHVVSFASSAVFESAGVGQASVNAAVLSLTSGAAATLAPHGIAVNCIVRGALGAQGGMPAPDSDGPDLLPSLVAHLATVDADAFTGRYVYCAGRDVGLYAMPLVIEQAHLMARIPDPIGPEGLGEVLAPLVEVGQA